MIDADEYSMTQSLLCKYSHQIIIELNWHITLHTGPSYYLVEMFVTQKTIIKLTRLLLWIKRNSLKDQQNLFILWRAKSWLGLFEDLVEVICISLQSISIKKLTRDNQLIKKLFCLQFRRCFL